MSRNVKLRHGKIRILPDALYATECINISSERRISKNVKRNIIYIISSDWEVDTNYSNWIFHIQFDCKTKLDKLTGKVGHVYRKKELWFY